eukprot:6197622-Pleurochrysis_carterae.AAC.6
MTGQLGNERRTVCLRTPCTINGMGLSCASQKQPGFLARVRELISECERERERGCKQGNQGEREGCGARPRVRALTPMVQASNRHTAAPILVSASAVVADLI